MGSQSSNKKLQIKKERLRKLTAEELRTVAGGNEMEDARETSAGPCYPDTDTCTG
jgi:hypothetical protein